MITYEYRCEDCGAHYFLRLPVDHETPCCFHCETKLVLVLHPPGLAFKGPGFHVNDYPKGGNSGTD